jgi:hypothetical protein
VLIAFHFGGGFSTTRDITMFGGSGNDTYILGVRPDSYGGQDSGGVDTAVLVSSGSIENLEGVEKVVLYGMDPTVDAQVRAALGTVYAAANFGAAYTGSIGNATTRPATRSPTRSSATTSTTGSSAAAATTRSRPMPATTRSRAAAASTA